MKNITFTSRQHAFAGFFLFVGLVSFALAKHFESPQVAVSYLFLCLLISLVCWMPPFTTQNGAPLTFALVVVTMLVAYLDVWKIPQQILHVLNQGGAPVPTGWIFSGPNWLEWATLLLLFKLLVVTDAHPEPTQEDA